MMMRVTLLTLLAGGAQGHGQLNHPPSTRQGLAGKTWPGALFGRGAGGYCEQPSSMSCTKDHKVGAKCPPGKGNPLNGACMLFSQPNAKQPTISITKTATLNEAKYRTNNVNCSAAAGCKTDWTLGKPWRDPGMAPVLGSGCGVGGGGEIYNGNGGWPPTDMLQGQDPLAVTQAPVTISTSWARGSNQTVAMGIWANHGGGYSYRLCKNDGKGKVSETCFQAGQLKFANDETQWLQNLNGSVYSIPATKWTTAKGAEWMKIPIPTCKDGGSPDHRGFTDGVLIPGTHRYTCGPNGTEYPQPLLNGQSAGLFGFGYCNETLPEKKGDCYADQYHNFSVVDKVVVPKDIAPGQYLLSWRWDCEQTTQIWQNCADLMVV